MAGFSRYFTTATQINVALVGKYSKIDSTVQGTYPEGSITR
jgi:hypothetical protein